MRLMDESCVNLFLLTQNFIYWPDLQRTYGVGFV